MPDTKLTNFPKFIKRLELIKKFIALEVESDIIEQVDKLQKLEIDDEIKNIITLLQQKAYGKAVTAIENYINAHHSVSIYIDPEIEALRFEAKTLEAQLQQLSNEKAELEKLIHEFGVRHNQELGELIIKILEYRKKQSKGTPLQKEAEKDYNDYYSNYEATKDEKIAILTEEEKTELKNKYRKASKLCHPDVVSDEQKETAHAIFMELNVAYESNDIERVKEILEDLQKGKTFTSKADTSNEKLTLQVELERLRKHLNELNKEIIVVKTSEAFEKITSINDWNEYFTQIRQQLQEQLNQLSSGKK